MDAYVVKIYVRNPGEVEGKRSDGDHILNCSHNVTLGALLLMYYLCIIKGLCLDTVAFLQVGCSLRSRGLCFGIRSFRLKSVTLVYLFFLRTISTVTVLGPLIFLNVS